MDMATMTSHSPGFRLADVYTINKRHCGSLETRPRPPLPNLLQPPWYSCFALHQSTIIVFTLAQVNGTERENEFDLKRSKHRMCENTLTVQEPKVLHPPVHLKEYNLEYLIFHTWEFIHTWLCGSCKCQFIQFTDKLWIKCKSCLKNNRVILLMILQPV